MSQVFLLRHGRAMVGELDYDHLHPIGEQQALRTAQHLYAQAEDIQSIRTGTLKRQVETATVLAEEYKRLAGKTLPIIHDERYVEIPLDDIIRLHVKSHVQRDSQLGALLGQMEIGEATQHDIIRYCFKLWRKGDFDCYGVETYADCKKRIEAVASDYRQGNLAVTSEVEGGAQLVVSSLGTIYCILQILKGLELEDLEVEVKIANTSITRIDLNHGCTAIAYENSFAHLSQYKELLTF